MLELSGTVWNCNCLELSGWDLRVRDWTPHLTLGLGQLKASVGERNQRRRRVTFVVSPRELAVAPAGCWALPWDRTVSTRSESVRPPAHVNRYTASLAHALRMLGIG